MKRYEFPYWENPRVSILVLAWRQPAHLTNCLRALHETVSSAIPYEVVILLNGATPEVEEVVRSAVGGVRVVSVGVNLGFAGGNNLAAGVARGSYLILLNDDAVVEPGWLEWLVATADANPRAGAVGSCVMFSDGRIQEAGSIIWHDGSTMPVGRGLPGDSLDWHFVRPVDYCSACSLLVRRSTWEAIRGLDDRYYPAYYEDTDMSLAIRARGEHILYEPRSRVRHHESASSDSRFKQFLFDRNRRSLVEKWRDELTQQEFAAPSSPAAIARAVWRARGCPRRILTIDDCVPDRSIGSGFGRMCEVLLELADAGYAVAMHPTWKVIPPGDALVSKGIKIVVEPLAQHLGRADVSYEAVIVSRPHNFHRVMSFVRRHQPQAILLYDAEALFWRRVDRQAKLATDHLEAERLCAEARDLREVEERILREADYAVALSNDEAEWMNGVEGHCPIHLVPPIVPSVPWTTRAFAERRDVGYVSGWLAGPLSPNADGLRWFVTDVLPLLRDRMPWVRLCVTGANAPPAVKALGNPNLQFVGHVEHLAEFYDRIRLIIAPIRYGAGVKAKTVEALQHGVPIVSTTVGAEGIDTQGLPAIDVADDPRRFADRIVTLLSDSAAWEARRESIAELVKRWRAPQRGETWTGALEESLLGRARAEYSILVQR